MDLDSNNGVYNGHNPQFAVCIMTESQHNEPMKTQEYLTNGDITIVWESAVNYVDVR